MIKEFLVVDPVGLHARPATIVVNEASKFASDSKIIYGEKEANLKSIMGVMSLGIATNTNFVIECSGPDEEEALAGIEAVLLNNNVASNK